MTRTAKTRKDAIQIRAATGTRLIEVTAERAVTALTLKGIPSLLCGGLVVQEYGYPRETNDVDLIVPDVKEAYDALSIMGFKPKRETPGVTGFMVDRETKVDLDLLPGGKSLGGPFEFPMPHTVSKEPTMVNLNDLLSLKLSSSSHSPMIRSKDHADVVELIIRRELPRDFDVDTSVQKLWLAIWDAIAAEKERDNGRT